MEPLDIEHFIKHLEKKRYIREIEDDHYLRFYSQENIRQYSYNKESGILMITEYEGDEKMPPLEDIITLYYGKIESLDQFDLIDRLTT